MSKDIINVGLLFSKTGVTAPAESSQLRGAILAIDEINTNGGVLGKEIVPIYYDPHSQTDEFRKGAEQLICSNDIKIIFGGYRSSSRKILLPIMEKYDCLLFYPQQYEGFEFSNHVIYGGSSPNQNAVPLEQFMVKRYGSRAYLVGSQYVYPYECCRTMQELILQEDSGSIVGERYIDLSASYDDCKRIAIDIKKRSADFIFCTVVGSTVPLFYKAYADVGIDRYIHPIASLNTSETEIKLMGNDLAEGHITSAPYFQSIKTEENKKALSSFRSKYGDNVVTDMNWEVAYYQVHLFAEAYRRVGTERFSSLILALKGCEYSAPQGHIWIDAANQHTALNPRIGIANRHGEFDIMVESEITVVPDPYMASIKKGSWRWN